MSEMFRKWNLLFVVSIAVLIVFLANLKADPGYIQQPSATSGFGPVTGAICMADGVYLEFGDACDPTVDGGIVWSGSSIDMYHAGSRKFSIASSQNQTWQDLVATASGGPRMLNEAATRTNPVFTNNDLDTGVGFNGISDTVVLVSGGTTMFECEEDTDDVCEMSVGLSLAPSADQSLANDGAIACNSNAVARVAGSGGAVTLSADPSISDGYRDGQFCVIQGTSDANTVTINNATNVDLRGSSSVTLNQGATLVFVWDSGDSLWYRTPHPPTAASASFSSLWYHGAVSTTTIVTTDTLTKIATFDNVGDEDTNLNAVGDPTTDDDITIAAGASGVYNLGLQSSFRTNTGTNKAFKVLVCLDLNTALTITDCTNATPPVVTSASHGLRVGDVVTISGVGGNTACNGDHVVAASVTTNTFTLDDLDHSDVVGSGAYTTGGTVDRICPGNATIAAIVDSSELERAAVVGTYTLSASDTISAYVANTSDATEFVTQQINLTVQRLSQ
jgi:hypothetical protein